MLPGVIPPEDPVPVISIKLILFKDIFIYPFYINTFNEKRGVFFL